MLSLRKVYRYEVFSEKGKRIGRVGDVLFAPGKRTVVGFVVQRPRLLMLFDLRDRYLALDSVRVSDGAMLVTRGRESWGGPAAARLGLSWDDTVVWQGMPARTESGRMLGVIRDGLFDAGNGTLSAVGLSSGVTADAAMGVRDMSATLVKGFDGEAVVFSDEAVAVQTSGGAAAAAGRGAAVAKSTAEKAAKSAVIYGKAAAKVAARSETGKKAMGWLKAAKKQVVDAMGEDDES